MNSKKRPARALAASERERTGAAARQRAFPSLILAWAAATVKREKLDGDVR